MKPGRFLLVLVCLALAACSQNQEATSPSVTPSPSPSSVVSSLPAPTATPSESPTPSAPEVLDTVPGVAIDGGDFNADDEDYYDLDDGDACKSNIVKGGETVTLTGKSGTWHATLHPGKANEGECWFTFTFASVNIETGYTLTLPGQKRLPVTAATAEEAVRLDLVPVFSKAELAYAKAADADLSDPSDVASSLSRGREDCDELARYTRTGRVALIIEDGSTRYEKAVKYLCPKFADDITDGKRSFSDGTNTVGNGNDDIKPGTYRTAKNIQDCYWERTDDNGNTRSNDFVSYAPKGVTITLRNTGGGFVSRGCGAWIRID